jgi:hypothetical protein
MDLDRTRNWIGGSDKMAKITMNLVPKRVLSYPPMSPIAEVFQEVDMSTKSVTTDGHLLIRASKVKGHPLKQKDLRKLREYISVIIRLKALMDGLACLECSVSNRTLGVRSLEEYVTETSPCGKELLMRRVLFWIE